MDKHLQTHHRHQFKQAEGTPFTVPPISKIIDFNESTAFFNQMWQGIALIDELQVEEDIKEYLHELQTLLTDLSQLSENLTTEEAINSFKIWNEVTSTSPMGRYLSIYKVWIGAKGNTTQDGKTCFNVVTSILKMATYLSKPLKRWAMIHNLFLLKTANDYRTC
eukprot:9415608-Ditylum_brightwellii.AAC.1